MPTIGKHNRSVQKNSKNKPAMIHSRFINIRKIVRIIIQCLSVQPFINLLHICPPVFLFILVFSFSYIFLLSLLNYILSLLSFFHCLITYFHSFIYFFYSFVLYLYPFISFFYFYYSSIIYYSYFHTK